jgi:hypothetical protein
MDMNIDYDVDMDRFYIPVNSRYEIQTKGKGSSFRIANTETNIRMLIADEHLHEMLEDMARGTNAELSQLTATIKDLQQKLLASQASEARLREALNSFHIHDSTGLQTLWVTTMSVEQVDEALSIPPNTADLDKYVESEIERRFEVTGYWIATLNGKYPYIVNNMADVDDGYDANPLYAKKG